MHRRQFLAGAAALVAQVAPGKALAQEPGSWRHPDLDHALTLVRARQWRDLCAFVDGLAPQRAYVLLGALGDEAPTEIDFGDIASQPSGDTVAAAIQIGWAWRFRGHGFADTVTQAGWTGFSANLNLAKTRLDRAVARDADNGLAQALRFSVYTGLSDVLNLTQSMQPFLMAKRRPVGGFSAYANGISDKWLGSEDMALGFARQAHLLDLPSSAGLIPDVHFLCWEARAMHDAAHTADFQVYANQANVRAEIIAANDAYGLVAPDADQFANWYANAWFSYTLLAINEPALAAPHLRNMGDYIGGPWEDVPDASRVISGIRHRLGIEVL